MGSFWLKNNNNARKKTIRKEIYNGSKISFKFYVSYVYKITIENANSKFLVKIVAIR